MTSHHRSHFTAATPVVVALAAIACGGARVQSTSATAAVTKPTASSASPPAASSHAGVRPQPPDQSQDDDNDDAELVVSRDVVAACPKLGLVRQHVAELDPDMLWVAVLDSLGQCMSADGPLAQQSLGVSGDEQHRHVVREVLGSRGVAPTRVVATKTSVQGAAECQGGVDCSKRVEITIAPAP
jgi:hypothetical protein